MVLFLIIVVVASVASFKTGIEQRTVPALEAQNCGPNEYKVRCKTICPPHSAVFKAGPAGPWPEAPRPQPVPWPIASLILKTALPPQTCNISYTDYFCESVKKCIPGCDCIKNYLRNNENVCVFNENCPPPPSGPSDIPEQSTQPSPYEAEQTQSINQAERSEFSSSQSYASNAASEYASNHDTSELTLPDDESNVPIPQPPKGPSKSTPSGNTQVSTRSESSVSALSSSSLSSESSSSESSATSYGSSFSSGEIGGEGGEKRYCTHNKCTPTCSLPSPKNCPEDSNPCNCPPGTIISEEGGECVERKQCEKYINCKGDYNATYSDCPIGCPSTCAKPNAEYCDTQCRKENLGCTCKPGYILSEKNGKCIKTEDCPGGGVCRKNETFVFCSVTCPYNYCPTDDNRFIIACDPPYPCPNGCSCQEGYRRKSRDEYICILASECPPVKCTRPNEEWNPCPKLCFSDHCRDRNRVRTQEECFYSGRFCNPQCVCKQGFFRNGTDICVQAEECPIEN